MNDKVQIYEMPSLEEMNRRLNAMEDLWVEFLKSENLYNLEYHIHKPNMFEVLKRQDQRMYYLYVFHELELPCEYKYIAILCFWINTLKPFMVLDTSSRLYDSPNEKFSLFLILSAIRTVFEVYHEGEEFKPPSTERMRDILYDFKYCSLSREAMISFVETFADNYGVGIEFILSNPKEISKALKGKRIMKLFGFSE